MFANKDHEKIMRVCMMVYYYWPAPAGGTEAQCRKLTRHLVAKGVECTVLTGLHGRGVLAREDDCGTRIVRVPVAQLWIDRFLALFPKRPSGKVERAECPAAVSDGITKGRGNGSVFVSIVCWFNALTFIVGASAWLWIHRREFDILHVHTCAWIAGYAGWIGSSLGIPVVCKGSYYPVFYPVTAVIPWHRKWDLWRRKVHHIAMLEAIREELIAGGVQADHILNVPNGVELPWDTADVAGGSYVLYVGNLSQGSVHKGFDILFEAWVRVHEALPSARLVVAGGGDAAPWKKLVPAGGCDASIEFVGFVPDMDHLYRGAQLLILSSRGEGISNALLEAQSWGIPAVVSDIPGNVAVVKHGETGLIVPVGDADDLAKAMISLISDPARRKEMGLAARCRIEKEFSMERIAVRIVDVYNWVCEREHEAA